jgi:hypothetical protein
MSDNIWDTPEAAAMGGGEYFSFTEPATFVGTWISIDFSGGTDFNGNECPLVLVEDDDGEVKRITAAQKNLQTKIKDARPNKGDRVAIGWDGTKEKMPAGDMKVFTVEVKRSEAVAAEKPASLL